MYYLIPGELPFRLYIYRSYSPGSRRLSLSRNNFFISKKIIPMVQFGLQYMLFFTIINTPNKLFSLVFTVL